MSYSHLHLYICLLMITLVRLRQVSLNTTAVDLTHLFKYANISFSGNGFASLQSSVSSSSADGTATRTRRQSGSSELLSTCDSSVVVQTPPPTAAPTDGGWLSWAEHVGEDAVDSIEHGFDDAVSLVESVFTDALTAVDTIEKLMNTVAEVAHFVDDLVRDDGNGPLSNINQ
jgi:hypothetical protein